VTGRGPRQLRVDTHVHTAASYDSEMSPTLLLEAAADTDLDAVAVTDHDTVRGARIAADLASDRDLVVITGCEVSTADGHLLAIGVDAAPEPGRPLPRTATAVRRQGGIAVVPHPFQRSRHGASRADIDEVDGVEVYNAQTVANIRNEQARSYANEAGYAVFGASDAHRPGSVGLAATEVTLPRDVRPGADRIVKAMRAGRTRAVGRRTSTLQYVAKLVATARYRTTSLL